MLVYIDDKEVEELENDYDSIIAYIHDLDEIKPHNQQHDYAYVEEYEPSYEEGDYEEESAGYEIEYEDINDFSS